MLDVFSLVQGLKARNLFRRTLTPARPQRQAAPSAALPPTADAEREKLFQRLENTQAPSLPWFRGSMSESFGEFLRLSNAERENRSQRLAITKPFGLKDSVMQPLTIRYSSLIVRYSSF
jgi:hypothetical protein